MHTIESTHRWLVSNKAQFECQLHTFDNDFIHIIFFLKMKQNKAVSDIHSMYISQEINLEMDRF